MELEEGHMVILFKFLKIHKTLFPSSWITLHSHQESLRIPIFPHPNTCFLFKKITAILVCVKGYFLVVWICTSPMTKWCWESVHSLAICISSLAKSLFKFFAHFLTELFVFCCWAVEVLQTLWILNLYQIMIYEHLLPFCGLSFHSIISVLWCRKDFNFSEVQFIKFSSCCLYFWCHI